MSESNRRDFIKSATGAGIALGMAGSAFAARGAKQSGRVLGANDRINIGVVGVGGRGSYVAEEFQSYGDKNGKCCQIVAVCDVYEKRKREAADKFDAKGFLDYHEALNQPDIDAVVVATPDHWHAQIALEAMDAGKDVYCEKPMCHTNEEIKDLVATVKETQRVLPGRLADDLGRSVVEGEKGHRRRHDRQHDHEPGLLPSQLHRRRVELAHRQERRSGRQGRRLHRLENVARQGAETRLTTPTASSASANIGIIPAASRPTFSITLSRL